MKQQLKRNYNGLIDYILILSLILGISKSPYGITGIVLMQSLSNFSLAALILIGFLNNLDRSQLDSARNLGAKTNRLIIDIILPFLFPAIKSVMLLTFLRSLSDFGTPAIIGGSFNVLATESYFAVIAQGNLGKASAINVLLLIPAIIIFILYQKSFKNISISSHGTVSSEIEIKRQSILFYLISIIAVFFLLWISIQYSSIILSAFTKMKKGKMIFTFANILETRDHITSTVKILHCLAQLPMKTGSGVYFSTLVEGKIKKGHENAVLYGTQLPFAEKTFNESLPDKLQGSVKEYPIKFLSDYVQEEKTVFNADIPFPIAGMSDIMPYTSTVYSKMNDEMYQKWISVFEKTLLRAKEEFNPDVIISHHLFILTSLVKKINTSGIIEFVKLPRIYDVDKAYEEDKPAFVEALAEKIMLQMERLKSQKDFYSPVAEEIKKHSWDSIIDRVEVEIKDTFSY